jgi:hypothetical protein
LTGVRVSIAIPDVFIFLKIALLGRATILYMNSNISTISMCGTETLKKPYENEDKK